MRCFVISAVLSKAEGWNVEDGTHGIGAKLDATHPGDPGDEVAAARLGTGLIGVRPTSGSGLCAQLRGQVCKNVNWELRAFRKVQK
jgi:hypothetical protein